MPQGGCLRRSFSSTITTVIAFFGLTAISGRFGDLDLRYSVYRDRGVDGVLDGMFHYSAKPPEPFHCLDGKVPLV